MIIVVGSDINIIIVCGGINHTFVTRGREIKDTIIETIHCIVVVLLLLTVNVVIMVWVP